MTDVTRRPLYHDYQEPELHRTGIALRRGYGTGPADTAEERTMREMLKRVDSPSA
ncbi:hypothetical protein [Sphingomonas sp.]|uniref:hypothetical protein n=1 Tax=Sphingomonas sp. TaxID=28214 RepID=UPI003CC5AC75